MIGANQQVQATHYNAPDLHRSATVVVESGLFEPMPSRFPPASGDGESTKCLLVDPPTDRWTTPASLPSRPGGCRRGPAAFLIALLISGPSLYLNDMSGS